MPTCNFFFSIIVMGIEQMYSVTRGENGAWGIEGYEVAKKYFDARKV